MREVHHITHEIAVKEGKSINDILLKEGLKADLLKCDFIVAHNCLFDFNVLLNELFRVSSLKLLIKLTKMYDDNDFLCTAEYSKNICKIPFDKNATYRSYKIPKLKEVYWYFYRKKFEEHNATKSSFHTN